MNAAIPGRHRGIPIALNRFDRRLDRISSKLALNCGEKCVGSFYHMASSLGS
jgi:hypothetical protein